MTFGSIIIGLKRWRNNKYFFAVIFSLASLIKANAQTAEEIVQKIKTKLERINDY